jgi:hypothetical protein
VPEKLYKMPRYAVRPAGTVNSSGGDMLVEQEHQVRH